jgi:hypothetical protein
MLDVAQTSPSAVSQAFQPADAGLFEACRQFGARSRQECRRYGRLESLRYGRLADAFHTPPWRAGILPTGKNRRRSSTAYEIHYAPTGLPLFFRRAGRPPLQKRRGRC